MTTDLTELMEINEEFYKEVLSDNPAALAKKYQQPLQAIMDLRIEAVKLRHVKENH